MFGGNVRGKCSEEMSGEMSGGMSGYPDTRTSAHGSSWYEGICNEYKADI